MNMNKQSSCDKEKIKSAITELSSLSKSLPPLSTTSPYQGLDRLSILITSLGTLGIIFRHTADIHASLDHEDCETLAAFVTLLEEDFENILENLYRDKP